ncbi:hypothetical protein TNIN_394031 [Trichonephila inaurata madagascariensis]|uniref:Uncharacterized protein n=1 Tax=Trichonephila inaurata madagascariensis TaxID=2747483 RepID=A0A8X6Y837_9ARAC|nr:hypothetical protein TNIN_394031 [Trichonephila inaurata madagascariensis]
MKKEFYGSLHASKRRFLVKLGIQKEDVTDYSWHASTQHELKKHQSMLGAIGAFEKGMAECVCVKGNFRTSYLEMELITWTRVTVLLNSERSLLT